MCYIFSKKFVQNIYCIKKYLMILEKLHSLTNMGLHVKLLFLMSGIN
jgi:hypothetical protein